MHGKPGHDYLADFAAIGAKPGCSSAELEAAWRRRVSDLHPDRPPSGGADGGGDSDPRAELSEINGAYRRLRHFQRRHGRMPGSALPPGAGDQADVPGDLEHRPWHGPIGPTWLLALFNASLLALLAVLVWILLERVGIRDHDAPGRRADALECMPSPPQAPADRYQRAPLRNSTTSTV